MWRNIHLTRHKFFIVFISLGLIFFIFQFSVSLSMLKFTNKISSFLRNESYLQNTINEHVYQSGTVEKKMPGAKGNTSLLLFIAVLNKATSFERRDAVRTTWMSACNGYEGRVVCMFFTDTIDGLSQVNQTRIKVENSTHNDMIFMPYKGGYNFAIRLVWILKWVTENYKFEFFLRIDDDHFLCIDRLVGELPQRPKQSLYWGYIHCRERIVRVDEGWMILTSDLVHEALEKLNTSLPCHPFGDQAVALWMIDSKYNVTYFYDNDRVINAATAYKTKDYLKPDICSKFLSLHGSYPKFMKAYWNITRLHYITHKPKNYSIPAIPRYESKCKYSNKIFDLNNFWPGLRFDVKPCKDEPTWSNSRDEFYSREIYGEDP